MNAVKKSDFSPYFNKILCSGFVLLAVYAVFISKEYGAALSNGGIALAFDPFNQQAKWDSRPLYQRLWLIAHVMLVLVGLIYLLLNGIKS